MGKLTLVTGVPGTRIQRSLTSFVAFASTNFGRSVVVHSLEADFQARARPQVAEFHPEVGASPTVIHTFLLPGPLIRDLWREAFESVTQRAEESRLTGDVIVTLHLSFFLHSTREYFFPADLSVMIGWIKQNVDEIVTFVDDIYDVHHSLIGGTDDVGMLDPPSTLESTVHDLMQILDWRSIEGMLASSLSASAEKPHYQFAVKHPAGTFHDLIYTDKQVVYLSHPISEPRRLFSAGERSETVEFVRNMQNHVSRLRSSATVIEPTAIDEWRFAGGSANLSARWPFGPDERELLYVPPDPPPPAALRFVFPAGWAADEREALEASDAVTLLQKAIERQINARDHSLVEETDRIACYRPLFRGNASRGVEEELRHFAGLVKLGMRTGQTSVVLMRDEDRKAFAQRTVIERLLPGWRKNGLLQGQDTNFNKFIQCVEAGDSRSEAVARGELDTLRSLLRECELSANPDSIPGGGTLGATEATRRQTAEGDLALQIQSAVAAFDRLAQGDEVKIVSDEQAFYNAFEA